MGFRLPRRTRSEPEGPVTARESWIVKIHNPGAGPESWPSEESEKFSVPVKVDPTSRTGRTWISFTCQVACLLGTARRPLLIKRIRRSHTPSFSPRGRRDFARVRPGALSRPDISTFPAVHPRPSDRLEQRINILTLAEGYSCGFRWPGTEFDLVPQVSLAPTTIFCRFRFFKAFWRHEGLLYTSTITAITWVRTKISTAHVPNMKKIA